MDTPTLRLKPKMDPRRLRHGFPWVYFNEIVSDRRTRNIPAGTVGLIEDSDKNPICTIAINMESKIVGRRLDVVGVEIDASWVSAKVAAAHAHRARLYDQPFYRLIHAEADGLPGVIADRFGDTVVMQPNAAWADQRVHMFVDAFLQLDGVQTVLMNGTGRARSLEGLEDQRTVLHGTMPPEPVHVPMNGATYMADLEGGQKTGLFFDQRPNHAFVQNLCQGAEVLDVFSHVGGFGLAAQAAGATAVTCVDGSQPALDLAERGHRATGGETLFQTVKADAFDALQGFADEGRSFDIVICDPPAFAPSKQAMEAGLRAYERIARLAAGLVRPGGYLALCSCSHAATLEKFRASNARGIGRAGRQGQLIYTGEAGPDHPKHLMLSESGYLKSLVYRLA